jgi:SulP family sulfate permease
MLDVLPCIPLFHDLEVEQVALLKPLFEGFNCPPETVIFEQGDLAGYVYLLTKGEVAIRYKPYDGPSLVLTRLRTGDVFGWSALIGSRYYTSSIVSETYVEALRIRGAHLVNLLRENPETGRVILDRLANSVSPRWKNAHEQVESLLYSRPNK